MDDEILTGNAGKELSSKALNMAVWKRNEGVALEKVKYTLTEQIHDKADMTPEIEAVSEMNASVFVFIIVGFKCF